MISELLVSLMLFVLLLLLLLLLVLLPLLLLLVLLLLFSHTAGDGGELQAMESLASGLCSRGISPSGNSPFL